MIPDGIADDPAVLVDSLRDRPIPSNDWWQSLLITNGGNAMYLNPLVADFTAEGLWLTNPGEGYFSGTNPGNGRQTITSPTVISRWRRAC